VLARYLRDEQETWISRIGLLATRNLKSKHSADYAKGDDLDAYGIRVNKY